MVPINHYIRYFALDKKNPESDKKNPESDKKNPKSDKIPTQTWPSDYLVNHLIELRQKSQHVLRPNPNWEEDLYHATTMEERHMARVLSYPRVKKVVKRPVSEGRDCKCTKVWPSKGLAPLLLLNSGRLMPSFGLGTWLGAYDYTIYNAVYWAIDAGYRHIDTAANFSTEAQVGWAINTKIQEGVVRREDIFITTKLWNNAHSPEAVVRTLRASLHNLNLNYVDLYLIAWPVGTKDDGSFDETDYLDTWKGMQEARDLGLTKSIGVSNFNIEQLERLITLSTEKPAALQTEINLTLQEPELLTFCRKYNIAVIAYTPFGSLFHARARLDAPPPRSDDQALLKMGQKYCKTVPQILLRYLVELGVVPIPKSETHYRICTNIQVYDFRLTPEERQFLRGYDAGYHTVVSNFKEDSPNYPFKKKKEVT